MLFGWGDAALRKSALWKGVRKRAKTRGSERVAGVHTGGVVDRCGQKLAHVGILISFPLPLRPLLPLLSPSLV